MPAHKRTHAAAMRDSAGQAHPESRKRQKRPAPPPQPKQQPPKPPQPAKGQGKLKGSGGSLVAVPQAPVSGQRKRIRFSAVPQPRGAAAASRDEQEQLYLALARDRDEQKYLEQMLGISSGPGGMDEQKKLKLRSEFSQDGLEDLFDLVHGFDLDDLAGESAKHGGMDPERVKQLQKYIDKDVFDDDDDDDDDDNGAFQGDEDGEEASDEDGSSSDEERPGPADADLSDIEDDMAGSDAGYPRADWAEDEDQDQDLEDEGDEDDEGDWDAQSADDNYGDGEGDAREAASGAEEDGDDVHDNDDRDPSSDSEAEQDHNSGDHQQQTGGDPEVDQEALEAARKRLAQGLYVAPGLRALLEKAGNTASGGASSADQRQTAATSYARKITREALGADAEALAGPEQLAIFRRLQGYVNRVTHANLGHLSLCIHDLFWLGKRPQLPPAGRKEAQPRRASGATRRPVSAEARRQLSQTLAWVVVQVLTSSSTVVRPLLMCLSGILVSLQAFAHPEVSETVLRAALRAFHAAYRRHHKLEAKLRREDAPLTPEVFRKLTGLKTIAANMLLLVCYCFNLGGLSQVLVYDLARLLCHEAPVGDILPKLKVSTEFDVELLVHLMQASGHSLMEIDRQSCSAMVKLVTAKLAGQPSTAAAAADGGQPPERVAFLLSVMQRLRRGRSAAGASSAVQEFDSGSESHYGTMLATVEKWLGEFNASQTELLRLAAGGAAPPLASGSSAQEDLRTEVPVLDLGYAGVVSGRKPIFEGGASAEASGRSNQAAPAAPAAVQAPEAAAGGDAADLLKMAQLMRMNTDVRRSIFCVLVGAEDYQDAYVKLTKLGLKESQEREIPSVILHCCGQERSYNPYYAALAAHMCGQHRRWRFAFQLAFWDVLKQLEQQELRVSARRVANLGQLLAFLVRQQALSLAVLKNLRFTHLPPSQMLFMHTFMADLLDTESPASLEQVSALVSGKDDLEALRTGLRYYLVSGGFPLFLKTLQDRGRAKRLHKSLKYLQAEWS